MYYSTNASDVTYFGAPIVHCVNGAEPSLKELLSSGAVLNSALTPSISAAQTTANSALSTANAASTTVTNWTKPGYTLINGNQIYTGDAYVDTLQIKGQAVTFPVARTLKGQPMSGLGR
jgi:hypothetical protein